MDSLPEGSLFPSYRVPGAGQFPEGRRDLEISPRHGVRQSGRCRPRPDDPGGGVENQPEPPGGTARKANVGSGEMNPRGQGLSQNPETSELPDLRKGMQDSGK